MNKRLQNRPLQNTPRLIWGLVLLSLMLIALNACQPAPVQINKNPFCEQPQNTNDDCSFALGEDKIWLSSSDNRMPIEEGVRLTLTSSVPLAELNGEIRGVSMYMGRLPVIWERADDGGWHADIYLGACTDPNMVWELRLEIIKATEQSSELAISHYSLRIPFQSYRENG